MPVVTRISEQKRRPNRRNIYLDGHFAFGLNLNVVARFNLREGLTLSPERVRAIEEGEVRQDCMDKALEYLSHRLHSRSELARKLKRQEHPDPTITAVLDDLTRLGYLNDDRFAHTKALSAAQHKHHGRRRAFMELLKSGVPSSTANRALDSVYESTDSTSLARQFAQKQAPRLRKLDPITARRRLTASLQRRGFDYDTIKPLLDEILGHTDPAQDA